MRQLWQSFVKFCWLLLVTHVKTKGVSRGSTLGQGAIAPKPRPCPQMWYETLFDELKASVYRCKKERSVAFKIRQNHAFPARNLPRTPLQAQFAPLDPQSAREGTFLSIPHPTSRLRQSPLGASIWWGISPKYFCVELPLQEIHYYESPVVCSIQRLVECQVEASYRWIVTDDKTLWRRTSWSVAYTESSRIIVGGALCPVASGCRRHWLPSLSSRLHTADDRTHLQSHCLQVDCRVTWRLMMLMRLLRLHRV